MAGPCAEGEFFDNVVSRCVECGPVCNPDMLNRVADCRTNCPGVYKSIVCSNPLERTHVTEILYKQICGHAPVTSSPHPAGGGGGGTNIPIYILVAVIIGFVCFIVICAGGAYWRFSRTKKHSSSLPGNAPESSPALKKSSSSREVSMCSIFPSNYSDVDIKQCVEVHKPIDLLEHTSYKPVYKDNYINHMNEVLGLVHSSYDSSTNENMDFDFAESKADCSGDQRVKCMAVYQSISETNCKSEINKEEKLQRIKYSLDRYAWLTSYNEEDGLMKIYMDCSQITREKAAQRIRDRAKEVDYKDFKFEVICSEQSGSKTCPQEH